MRLKLKHVDEPSQAHRLQLPGHEGAPPTLRDLSAAAAAALGARLPSGTETLSLRLSLNKQVVLAGDPCDTLAALGICNGDLLWVLGPPMVPAAASVAPLLPESMAAGSPSDAMRQQQQQQQRSQATMPAAPCAAEAPPVTNMPAASVTSSKGAATFATGGADSVVPMETEEYDEQQPLMSPPPASRLPPQLDRLVALLVNGGCLSGPQPIDPPASAAADAAAAPAAAAVRALSPAQLLVLAVHAAMLEAGFRSCPPQQQHKQQPPPQQQQQQQEGESLEREHLLSLLHGASGGLWLLTYLLPGSSSCSSSSSSGGRRQAAQSDTPGAPEGGAAGRGAAVQVTVRVVDVGHHCVLAGSVSSSSSSSNRGGSSSNNACNTASSVVRVHEGAAGTMLERLVTSITLAKQAVQSPRAEPAQTLASVQQAQPTGSVAAAAAAAVAAAATAAPSPTTREWLAACYSVALLPELWIQLQDRAVLPLLLEGCRAAGQELPAGQLLTLPGELLDTVLRELPAPALARLGCVCTALRLRVFTDTLWRPLFEQDFAAAGGAAATTTAPSSARTLLGLSEETATRGMDFDYRAAMKQEVQLLRSDAGRYGWAWAYSRARASLLRMWAREYYLATHPAAARFVVPPGLRHPPSHMGWPQQRVPGVPSPPGMLGGDYDRLPALSQPGVGGFAAPGFLSPPQFPGGHPAGILGGPLGSSGGGGLYSDGGGRGSSGPGPLGLGGGRGSGGNSGGGGGLGMPGLGGRRREGGGGGWRLY